MSAPDNAALLQSATRGFDHLFSNDVTSAKAHFTGKDDPFHLLGLGVCAFLEAALGMESGLMTEATRLLTLSEAGARRQAKLRPAPSPTRNGRQPRFPPGLEWEILGADAIVLLGLTNALSESYMGYFQCMYALNSAHSKFTKLYKTVYPHGLDAYATPAHSGPGTPTSAQRASTSSRASTSTSKKDVTTPTPRQSTDKNTLTVDRTVRTSLSTSNLSVASSLSVTSTTSAQTTKSHLPPSATPTRSFFGNPPPAPALPLKHSISSSGGAVGGIEGAKTTGANTPTKSFFARWTGSAAASLPQAGGALVEELDKLALEDRDDELREQEQEQEQGQVEDGPVEELILAGTAFGFGLFNLVFSLLPKKIQSLVGFFGFKHDRRLALRALAVAAAKRDVHGVFAGLVLMTYHGVVLLLAGYQADEAHILRQYRAIVDSVEERYPQGALWILNRAKILRMSHDASGAIRVLRDGLKPDRPHSFAQADTLLVFELAWTLLGEMRYQDAADMFLKITELNSWSHGTYYFLAAGCYSALGKHDKAQQLYDAIPGLIDQKKIGGKDLPTEVLIKKKLLFYKEKQKRRGGDPALYAQAIKISTAEELGIFWNTHARIHKVIAEEHIKEWSALTPAPSFPSSKLASPKGKAPTEEPTGPLDLDTPDELALRSLLLGICHRTAGDFASARECLRDAYARQPAVKVSTWIGGVAMFELAVLDLKIVEHKERNQQQGLAAAAMLVAEWERALVGAGEKLDLAIGLATNTVDLSSRLDSRIMMLRDEIAAKKEKLGIA